MSGEPPRAARWLTGTGTAIRRAAFPALQSAARRESAAVLHLRRPSGPPSGTGSGPGRPYERLEDGCAVLRVVRAVGAGGYDGYQLQGACGDLTVTCRTGPTRLMAPAVSLGMLQEKGEFPSETLRAIQHWSANQGELAEWINRIRQRHGEGLRLIVWDDTGFELPWELFWVPADEQHGLGGGLLGALLVMARWTTVHGEDEGLPRETGPCRGRVLAYLHEDMTDDGSVFSPYDHAVHDTMTPFLQALDLPMPDDRTGLVYMGCHGTYGEVVMRLTLGDRTWAEFNTRDMHVLREDRSLVCLNACHSGRFVPNHVQGEEALRGFAELFLRKGAGGCIVTAGKVGDQEARALVRRLLKEVAARPDLPITETLRDFRARAVHDFGTLAAIPTTRNDDGQVDKVGQKRVLRLLYAFMFHYYGHPRTTLRLVAGEEHSAGGGDPW
ncbi:hypothetical protein SLINC_5682 [Streptomyces lincolnensis]|uniref:CHAT domain-containing protein n=1 Tax=Streptomyces lincolnensis TaxID=1915 RepID=A0A1B1MGZ7_STRLN|nr:CHAT domain-containing protein [Streptomyces lincolnensis]ANS67906.1 hypothetical protein SLINC_5682 [Streptomyces lincolnensis]AXG53889.1 hypothetical protein SLCG_2734 [Streptomyces lincolnensis]